MDAKTAVDVLKWMRIQADSQLKREIDKIVICIESLSHDAELGRAADRAARTNEVPVCLEIESGEWQYGYEDCGDGSCAWQDFCRLRAAKEGWE